MLTPSLQAVGEYLFNLLEEHQVELSLAAVYYSDQERIPVTPVVCVETGSKKQELIAAPRRTDTFYTVYLLVYHNAVQDAATTRREVEARAEAIETLVHTKPNLEGLVIHAYVTSLEHGYVTKGGSIFRASRLTVECQSKLTLPPFVIDPPN